MRAVILIGGLGTRLRPLTCELPKPLLPVLNAPFLHYQFRVLKAHGVREAVLCTSYRPEAFRKALGGPRSLGLKLHFVNETAPLGTGGAVKNAERLLGGDGPFLVLNGDVLNTLDISAFLAFHKRKRADLSIALTRVKDPTLYGLVQTDDSGLVRRFLEKPSWDEIESNTINAGAYLFDPSILSLIPAGTPYSLERSLFPLLLQSGYRLFGFVAPGYWIDIGTIERYLQVHLDILGGRTPFAPPAARRRGGLLLGKGVRLGRDLTVGDGGGRVFLGDRVRVGDFARFSGSVCVGPGCTIGRGAQLEDCVILEGSTIGEGARLERCVVGAGCAVGAQTTLVTPNSALAGGSQVKPHSLL